MNIENSAVVQHQPYYQEELVRVAEARERGVWFYVSSVLFGIASASLWEVVLPKFDGGTAQEVAEISIILFGLSVILGVMGFSYRKNKPDIIGIKKEINYCAEQLLELEPGKIYEMPWDKDGTFHLSRKVLTRHASRILAMESALSTVPEIFRGAAEAMVERERKELSRNYNRLLRNGMVHKGGYGPAFDAVEGQGEWTRGVTITPLPAAN